MLTPASRALLHALAVAHLALGAVLLLIPDWAASEFSWNVVPIVAATMGGWSLGTGAFAWLTARDGRLRAVGPMLVYLLAFGIGELAVLVAFREALDLTAILAWPYLLSLASTVVVAGLGVWQVVRSRSAAAPIGERMGPWVRLVFVVFVLFVGFLGIGAAQARQGGLSTTGGIFPEPMTVFTVRAFAAFYLALAVSGAALLVNGRMPATRLYTLAGLGLLVPITGVALANLDSFDFAARPGGLVYLGAYLAAAIASAWLLGADRLAAGRRDASTPVDPAEQAPA